jgi:monoamine oxidase
MSRSDRFARIARVMRVAEFCERQGVSTREGFERIAELEGWAAGRRRMSRRTLLSGLGGAAAGAAVSAGARRAAAAPAGPAPRVAIVGAGLAGLVCADQLRSKGILATVYEANPGRVGGRCFSLRGFFPGQVAENGGEFIDNLHKTMLGYARAFKLAVEDVESVPGDLAFHFFGRRFTEEEVVEEYRQLVPRMRPDLQASSGAPTFFEHNTADVELDHTDLATYLATRGEGLPLIQAALSEAYLAEYGREPHEQSCLNLLLFLHLDRRSRFLPFGVFSDERYHLVGGNDGIVQGLAARVGSRIEPGMKLERLRLNGLGEYELKFQGVGTVRRADTVVLAIPFTVLREVELHPNLGFSADKRRAIDELGYGTNAKTMVGFNGRPWLTLHQGNGTAYTDLENVQTTWETNSALAGARAILTDYASGDRGASLHLQPVQSQVEAFLTDLDVVYPGARAQATRQNGSYLAHREHWPTSPYVRGSYTCYTPGQFTGIAGLEGQPAGRLLFAGEHADSFYSWQGFMEGACLSGIAAAGQILSNIKDGVHG